MTTAVGVFPAPFSHLEPFASWALPTEGARCAKRMAATFEEVRAFYDALLASAQDALDYLDDAKDGRSSDEVRRLWWLLLAFAEVHTSVEVHGGVWRRHFPAPAVMRPSLATDVR